MDWYYGFTLTLFVVCIYLFDKRRHHSKMPPSPKGLPIIGHLHLIGALPHQALGRLAKLHGPLMSLRLGNINAIVVSSKEMAREVLKIHDFAFASRPNTAAARIMAPLTMGFGHYGEHWRLIRKLCTLELFTQKRLQESQELRKEEITWALSSILEESKAGRPVNLEARLCTLSTNFVTRWAFGKRFLGEGCDAARAKSFQHLIREEFYLFGAQNLGDSFPALAWLDVQGYERRMKASKKRMDNFLEAIIDEHIAKKSPQNSTKPFNLLEILLSKEDLSLKHVKSIILDILSGASDTSPATVQWGLSELIRAPRIMKKLQEEIDRVVGKDRVVVENDLPNLVYLQAVVKETFRLHPPGPLLLPHESMQDCKVAGFEIPKGTRLIVNAYAIGRDPNVWGKDTTEFKPERFINDPRDVKGRDFELIPFGSGRRMCPAMPLGLVMVQIFLARFVQSFDWALPGGQKPESLDMDETFGLNAFRASPLVVVPTPRLSPELFNCM